MDAELVFVADDFAAWLIGTLAEAGRKRLVTWARGSDQERALKQAADAALHAAVTAVLPEGDEGAEQLTLVVKQVFNATAPGARLDGFATLLEALQAGVAGQLAVLDDPDLTGTGVSSASVLGISAAAVADKLASFLVLEILANGARGGPLAGLARQLNDDATHLQGQRLERMVQQLIDIVLKTPVAHQRAPASWLISDLASPLMLGVHKAIAADGSSADGLSDLPVYVLRSHDEVLARLIESAQRESKLLVLTSDSSTGKTRALWEAVRRLPPSWRLWRPTDAEGLSGGLLAGIVTSHTVVWLDDAHEYLDPRRTQLAGLCADAIRDLIADPERKPVIVAVTMWPDIWRFLTDPADRRGQNIEDQIGSDLNKVARLLGAAEQVAIPSAFRGIDLENAREAASQDVRLARALGDARDGRLTQYLAGAPWLLHDYETASAQIRAVIDAAIDARRFGHSNQMPAALLLNAAPGYLDQDDTDCSPEDWAERALATSSAPSRGLDGALARTRSRFAGNGREISCYKLADALEQAGSATRRYSAPPQSFWDAVAEHGDPDEIFQMAYAADKTGRKRNAMRLLTRAGRAGDANAIAFLALEHEHAGDSQEAGRLALVAADLGDPWAAATLAQNYASTQPERAQRLYRAASRAGDSDALIGLAKVIDAQGDRELARTVLKEAAIAGNTRAQKRLAEAYDAVGDFDSADEYVLMMGLLNIWDIARERDQRGDAEGAERLALKVAHINVAGLPEDASWRLITPDHALAGLAQLCERAGAHDEADKLVLQVDDMREIWRLARHRDEDGDREGAVRLAVAGASRRPEFSGFWGLVDSADAFAGLAELCELGGRLELADQLALWSRSFVAVEQIVRRREAAADHELAEALALQALQHVGTQPVIELSRMRAGSDDKRLLTSAAAVAEPWALIDIALELEDLGYRDEAEQLVIQAAQAGNAYGLQRLGWSRKARDPDGAKFLFLQAVDAGEADALVDLARLCESAGDSEMAWLFWQAAAGRGVAVALEEMSASQERTGRHDEAENLAVKAAHAGSIDQLIRLAGIRAGAGDHERAGRLGIEAARAAAAAHARDRWADVSLWALRPSDVLAHLTDIRDKSGDHEGARKFAREAADADPDYSAALNKIAQGQAANGDSIGAARLYRVLADIGNAPALAGLARIRADEGDYRVAEELWLAAADAGYDEDDADPVTLIGSPLQAIAEMYEHARDWKSAERVHMMRLNSGEASLFELSWLYKTAGDDALASRVDRFGLNADGTVSGSWRFEQL